MGVDFYACADLYDGKKDRYVYVKGEKELDGDGQMQHALDLINRYKLYYVEDAFNDVDFTRTKELTRKAKCVVAGDDLFKSDKRILSQNLGAGNAITLKMDWIGTITDAFELADYAKSHSYSPLISQRAGETADNTIAHVAVAFRVPFIKMGIVDGARTEKLNELLRIEEELEVPAMAELPLLGRKGD
jgi:enolase